MSHVHIYIYNLYIYISLCTICTNYIKIVYDTHF